MRWIIADPPCNKTKKGFGIKCAEIVILFVKKLNFAFAYSHLFVQKNKSKQNNITKTQSWT